MLLSWSGNLRVNPSSTPFSYPDESAFMSGLNRMQVCHIIVGGHTVLCVIRKRIFVPIACVFSGEELIDLRAITEPLYGTSTN